MIQFGFCDVSGCYSRLDAAGDPLVKIIETVDWSGLAVLLDPIRFESGAKGGRPGWDPLIMVKCFLLQSLYGLSDDACEYQLNDRFSFKRFVGLGLDDKAPDAKTIWLYRERMIKANLTDILWDWFQAELLRHGYEAQKGQIIDAAIVSTHKPTKTHEDDLPPAMERQIDRDASFTQKHGNSYHGYKAHIQIDNMHKFVRKQMTTSAHVHDSQLFAALLETKANSGRKVWADSAYRSVSHEALLSQYHLTSQIHYKAYRNKPLSEAKQRTNHTRSKTRARVEHVFGHVITAMHGWALHTIGIARAEAKITLKLLTYNIQRFARLQQLKTT